MTQQSHVLKSTTIYGRKIKKDGYLVDEWTLRDINMVRQGETERTVFTLSRNGSNTFPSTLRNSQSLISLS